MKFGLPLVIGCLLMGYGMGMLQTVPRLAAWLFAATGAAVLLVTAVVVLVSDIRERRTAEKTKAEPPASTPMDTSQETMWYVITITPTVRVALTRAARRTGMTVESLVSYGINSVIRDEDVPKSSSGAT